MKTTIVQSMNQMTWGPIEDAARKSFEEKYEKEENQRIRVENQRLRGVENENVCLRSQVKSLLAEKKAGMWGPKLFIALRRDITKDLEKYSKRFATKSAKSRPKSKN